MKTFPPHHAALAMLSAAALSFAIAHPSYAADFEGNILVSSDNTCTPTVAWQDGNGNYEMTYSVASSTGALSPPASLGANGKTLSLTAPVGCGIGISGFQASSSLQQIWGSRNHVATTSNGGFWPFAPFLANVRVSSGGVRGSVQVTGTNGFSTWLTAASPVRQADRTVSSQPSSATSLVQAGTTVSVVSFGNSYVAPATPSQLSLFPRDGGYVSAPFGIRPSVASDHVYLDIGVVITTDPLTSEADPDANLVSDGETVSMPAVLEFSFI